MVHLLLIVSKIDFFQVFSGGYHILGEEFPRRQFINIGDNIHCLTQQVRPYVSLRVVLQDLRSPGCSEKLAGHCCLGGWNTL